MSVQAQARLDRVEGRQSATPWMGILIAVVLCGAIPALWNLTLLDGLHHNGGFLGVYFALSALLPLACGYGCTAAWKGATVGGVLALAAVAGGVEAALEVLVIPHVTVHDVHLVLAAEDYVAWGAIFCMFAAGGLYRIRKSRYSGDGRSVSVVESHRADVLQSANQILGLVGTLLSLYVTIKKL